MVLVDDATDGKDEDIVVDTTVGYPTNGIKLKAPIVLDDEG